MGPKKTNPSIVFCDGKLFVVDRISQISIHNEDIVTQNIESIKMINSSFSGEIALDRKSKLKLEWLFFKDKIVGTATRIFKKLRWLQCTKP